MLSINTHQHTKFSDGEDSMTLTVKTAIAQNVNILCITDHFSFRDIKPNIYEKNLPEYFNEYENCRKIPGIDLLIGIELDFYNEDQSRFINLLKEYPFDYVICSLHTLRLQEAEVKEQMINICDFHGFNALGHFDFYRNYGFETSKIFEDKLSDSLKALIDKGIALELNMHQFGIAENSPYPVKDILELYKSLGGMPPTIGNDAHKAQGVGASLSEANDNLKNLGWNSCTVFRNRKPENILLA